MNQLVPVSPLAIPILVAAAGERASTRELAAPSVKLAALRHLFDWLVNGQVVPVNPAHAVRGPRHVVTCSTAPGCAPIRRGRCSARSAAAPAS